MCLIGIEKIVKLISAFTLNGFNMPAYMNVVDVAPNFSGTVNGIVNGFGAGTGFVVPLITAAFTSENPSNPLGWRYVFLLATVIYAIAFCFYCFAGSAEPQRFNYIHDGPLAHNSDLEGDDIENETANLIGGRLVVDT